MSFCGKCHAGTEKETDNKVEEYRYELRSRCNWNRSEIKLSTVRLSTPPAPPPTRRTKWISTKEMPLLHIISAGLLLRRWGSVHVSSEEQQRSFPECPGFPDQDSLGRRLDCILPTGAGL